MPEIKSINRETIRDIRIRINEALAPLSQELGISIEAGNASFTPSGRCTFKLIVETKGEDGEAYDKHGEYFKSTARLWGLTAEHLGRKFTYAGKVFTLKGVKPNAWKNPFLGEDHRGKMYVFPEIPKEAFLS